MVSGTPTELNPRQFVRRLAVCASLLVLGGCVSLNPPPASDSSQRVLPGPAVAEFQLAGRALLRQGQRLDHFRFDWTHTPGTDVLLLTSPFGQGIAQVTRDKGGAQLRLANGQIEQAATLSDLAQTVFGSAMPLEELAEWLRAAYPARQGRADDWLVVVEEVSDLPSHVAARTLSVSRNDTLLRLIVDERGSPP